MWPRPFAAVLVYIMCSSTKSSRTRMPISSRVPVGYLAMPVLSYLLTSLLSGSSRGLLPVTSGPCLQSWEPFWLPEPLLPFWSWPFWFFSLLLPPAFFLLFLDMKYHLPDSMARLVPVHARGGEIILSGGDEKIGESGGFFLDNLQRLKLNNNVFHNGRMMGIALTALYKSQ